MKLDSEILGAGNSNAHRTLSLRGDSIFRSAVIVRVKPWPQSSVSNSIGKCGKGF